MENARTRTVADLYRRFICFTLSSRRFVVAELSPFVSYEKLRHEREVKKMVRSVSIAHLKLPKPPLMPS